MSRPPPALTSGRDTARTILPFDQPIDAEAGVAGPMSQPYDAQSQPGSPTELANPADGPAPNRLRTAN
jgi:hypothetical protein